jgi:hypothetical protein
MKGQLQSLRSYAKLQNAMCRKQFPAELGLCLDGTARNMIAGFANIAQ